MTAFRLRLIVVVVLVLYAFARFGAGIGLHALAGGAVLATIDMAIERDRVGRAGRGALIALHVWLAAALFFAPAPLGFGTSVPGPMMLQTPFLIGFLALLASRASERHPGFVASAGGAAILSWAAIFTWIRADPATITRDTVRLTGITTPLGFLRALNVPHYLNIDIWRTELAVIVALTAVLVFFAERLRRVAREAASREASRNALAAHFSPQVVDTLLGARDTGMTPRARRVAVLDCDLIGLTSYAETLSPERVAELLRAYRAAVADAVFGEGGAIFSQTGDGAVAVFGLGAEADIAGAALRAARHLERAWNARSDRPRVVVGLDIGEALVGLVGLGRAISLVMLGPPVEGAARLQAATRTAGTPILASDAVMESIRRLAL